MGLIRYMSGFFTLCVFCFNFVVAGTVIIPALMPWFVALSVIAMIILVTALIEWVWERSPLL